MSSARGLDSKHVHRLLFGVYYQEDIVDRLCGIAPLLVRAFGPCALGAARQRNLIFLHVPRTAGASISQALYGQRCIQHYNARSLRAMAPKFWDETESFAVLRDPFDRFASSYAFVRAGGTETCILSEVFRKQTRNLRCVDDYLSFIEERDVMQLDFVMRPQAWFACNSQSGLPLVKRLFLYGRDQAALLAYLRTHGVASLPWLNRCVRIPLALSRRQKNRIEAIYAADFGLMDQMARQARDIAAWRVAAVAAE